MPTVWKKWLRKSEVVMKTYYKLSDFHVSSKTVVSIGTFDGVHLGHQAIGKRLVEKAKEINGKSLILTFWPHPRLIVSPNNQEDIKLLSTIEEKIELIAEMGIDYLLILPFTREFSEMSAEKYLEEVLLEAIGTHTLVIGYDHRFGKNREGGLDFLQKHASRYKLTVEEISRQEVEELTISSTKIRKALENGNISLASDLLGRPYFFEGPVVKGRQLGRTIGFPTANVSVQRGYKLIPKNGVYLCRVNLRSTVFYGVMNIGNRPTVEGLGRTQEVFIFDFSDDIYGEKLKVEVLDYIRDEQKFDGLEALTAQIHKDIVQCKLKMQAYVS
jgi:riboflavin kinase / FMN adenylyltransferase